MILRRLRHMIRQHPQILAVRLMEDRLVVVDPQRIGNMVKYIAMLLLAGSTIACIGSPRGSKPHHIKLLNIQGQVIGEYDAKSIISTSGGFHARLLDNSWITYNGSYLAY